MHYHYFTIEQRETLERLIRQNLSERPDYRPLLDRLHSPDYGVCSACGADIPYIRLLVNPAEQRCRRCEAS